MSGNVITLLDNTSGNPQRIKNSKSIKYLNTLLFLFMLSNMVFAQSTLSGKIIDLKNNTPLHGASVYIPDLKIGTISNSHGIYRLKDIPDGTYLLEVSYLGYLAQSKQITINKNISINFALEQSSIEMQEVVVTGVPSATQQQSNPVPVSAVGQNSFLETTSNNIIDALKNSPGVSEITEGPAISKPIIRGLGYNRVVVVNDGIRQEGQQFGDEFGIEVDPYSIYKVEIMRGPASLSYGSDAMAGVINMLSFPTLPEGEIKGNIITNYQTNNGLYAGSAYLAGNNNNITWNARYTLINSHAYQDKYDGYVFNSGYGENNFRGSIGINRSWGYSRLIFGSFDLKLGIVEGGRDSATGQFTRHVLASDGSDSAAIASNSDLTTYSHNMIIHQHVRHYKVVLDNSIAIGDGRLGVRLGIQQNNRQEANDVTIGNIYNIYYFLNTFNYDINYILPEKNKLEFSFGTNGMQQASQNKGLLFLVPAYQLFDFGVFAIGKKTFNQLSIAGGLRFDNRSLHGDDLYLDSSGVKLNGPSPDAVHRFTAYKSNFPGISGSIGAAYDFSKALYGKINLSRGFRAPNIAESGSNGIHDGTPFYEIGDPNLKPESSLQLDVTLGYNSNDVSAELTVFDNNIDNYIFPVKLASVFGGDSISTDVMAQMSGPTFKYISGNAVITGAEFTFNIHPEEAQWFHFNNSFSMLSAIQKNQPDSTKYLPFTPPFKLVSGIEFNSKSFWDFFKDAFFRIDVEHCFKQDKIYYKFGDETVTPAYTLLNAGIGADVVSNMHTLFSFYLYGSNLLDEAYQSNMSRLKYGDTNNVTGRVGVFEMGRNISFKVVIPLDFSKN
ncbi:MAG TPA: TonB-dependent receptor [Ignavibacteriaceae bacterium]|nr:TonB-dependent receptor [Ignavibacteriaceae bacterium]